MDPIFETSAAADQMPDMFEACWSIEQVQQLFADIMAGAEVEHVQVRHQVAAGLKDQSMSISEAQQLFLEGRAQAIQIRYLFDGQKWSDTLMPQESDVRVIRLQMKVG